MVVSDVDCEQEGRVPNRGGFIGVGVGDVRSRAGQSAAEAEPSISIGCGAVQRRAVRRGRRAA